MDSENNYAIFHIIGDPSKNLIATCVVNSFHQSKPGKRIVVVTNFPEIWLHNPDVFRVYRLGSTSYFYEDYVANKNSEIYAHDPYLTGDFISDKKSIPEIWCEMIGIPFNNSLPKLYFTQREEEVAWRLTQKNKPTLLIQGNEIFTPFPNLIFDWTKDLPIYVLQKIANIAISKGYDVIQIRNQNQMAISGALTLGMNLRISLATLKNIQKVLTVDSYVQHACVALNKPAVVTWLSTSPQNRGYEIHKNISGNMSDDIKERLESYSPMFEIKGENISKPIIMEDVYDAEEIIKALDL